MAVIRVHVTPRGSRNEVAGWYGNTIHIRTTAPPVDGAANAAVVKLMADFLGVRKSQVRILAGENSREKTLSIEGLSDDEIRSRVVDPYRSPRHG
ncbi:MAG: DUF167 domain-containing protein [Armatimonadetes bacterium]|nr:DUF167 domain-containing protein [Armatimonadota bacterium]